MMCVEGVEGDRLILVVVVNACRCGMRMSVRMSMKMGRYRLREEGVDS